MFSTAYSQSSWIDQLLEPVIADGTDRNTVAYARCYAQFVVGWRASRPRPFQFVLSEAEARRARIKVNRQHAELGELIAGESRRLVR